MLETDLIAETINDVFRTASKQTHRYSLLVDVRLTRLVDSAEGMPGVVFAGLKAVFTEVEVVAVPAFEPSAVYREHLAAITPAGNTSSCLDPRTGGQTETFSTVHTSLQGGHWVPVPFLTTSQSSGTAEGSPLSHPFHWR